MTAMGEQRPPGSSPEPNAETSTPTERGDASTTARISPSPGPVEEPMSGTTATFTDAPKLTSQRVSVPSRATSSSGSSIRSRIARQASNHEIDSENADGRPSYTEKGSQEAESAGLIRRTALFRSPIKGDSEQWHHSIDRPSQWTSLFYDLVVVAVLTVFGLDHEISSPANIPAFLGYFVVIYWVWVSQVFYDIRYEAEDGVHRFFKFLQVCVFLYIGAASGNWAPGDIQTAQSYGETGSAAASTEDAEESYKTVVIAFTLSRAQLAIQYLICALSGRKAKRDVSGHWVSFATLVISCALNVASAAVVSRSSALVAVRLALLYASVLLEALVTSAQVYRGSHLRGPTGMVADRYGQFALIILGDGLLNIVRAFNHALAGLSDRDTGTYAQAFMAILIVYMLWSFLYSRFDKEAKVADRNVHIWELLHFPLSFSLLLLLSAITNAVLVIANGTGTILVLEGWQFVSERVKAGGMWDDPDDKRLGRYLYKLNLEPEWTDQLQQLQELYTSSQPSQENADLINLQYLGQIAVESFRLYGVEVQDQTQDVFATLVGLDTVTSSNATLNAARVDQAAEYVTEIINEPFTHGFSGTLWLYPTAGIVLILCAIRTILWNPAYTSLGHRIVLYFQVVAGVCVALLGLLDIGRKSVDVALYTNNGMGGAPMYVLVLYEVPLVIVSGVYAIVFLGPVVVQEWLHRRRGGIYVEEEKGWLSRVRSRISRPHPETA